ncbi:MULTISPECIES: ABC transporter ATP-binding protein [Phyllobacteriaceae]|uniref:Iron ABC transporter n=1 Tax=Mesorhizobium hungaricum TaxID=1566387 RepID=A0A1C2DKC7_9HYPH|nr:MULTISPECIES: ABC transporter ATP-binding protein [Mesorhizobium]MBN9233084.1 ABC transporter ATP-binding protein [Mesorhizobium sp.]MDQ0332231.1 iron complex transport system ATP-binding protein [Mesorhizobium sp. YL-MeA3-2017]OCX15146.1 iron ABC transporter [Mesorhizobium hungaricum]
MNGPVLQARGLCYRPETGVSLVEEVGIDLAAGERLAIIGPNGAGKTTLLRMLCGMLRPSRGTVSLEGQRLDRLSMAERARRIAVVGQSDQPDPRLSVLDYVGLGRIPHASLHGQADERDIVVDALGQTGLLPLQARAMGSLSGGERQRAQLARAIAQRPTVLFLDEPTNHLDPRARGELLEFVARLGIAVVTVLHDLPLVAPFATHVAVMDKARLRALGSPVETLTPALVREVFSIDVLRFPHPEERDRELTVFDVPIRLSR